MKYSNNMRAIEAIKPDFMGFIFYPKSKRFVDSKDLSAHLKALDKSISKVAVFVNEPTESIISKIKGLPFDYLQLHGQEALSEVIKLKEAAYKIIKAFPMDSNFNWAKTDEYEGYCEYFLFDTSSPNHGGSGQKFDWNMLQNYQGETPFLLSGGISRSDVAQIKLFSHPKFSGIDINSKFEIVPGLKDPQLIHDFIKELKR